MKISFDWLDRQSQTGRAQQTSQEQGLRDTDVLQAGNSIYQKQTVLDISGKVTDDFSYGDQGRFTKKLMQAADTKDYVALQRDYMTVMSNSMSPQDFQKMQDEGFDVYSMEPEASVTILDKIKTVMAQSGTEITGYNDDLSVDTLSAVTGSDGYAQAIAGELADADAPVTEENVRQVKEALEQAMSLTEPGEGALAYLVTGGMEPVLSNLYKAEHSSVDIPGQKANMGYTSTAYSRQGTDIQDVRKTRVAGEDYGQLEEQIADRVSGAGLEVNEDTMEQGRWLVENGIPVTTENLQLLQDIREISYPLDPNTVIRQAAQAVGEGRSPFNIRVNEVEDSIYQQAVTLKDRFDSLDEKAADYVESEGLTPSLINMEKWGQDTPVNEASLHARKTLEEVRLKMTTEANVKLLQSGFSIDTAPMEELIAALEEAQKQLGTSLFGETDGADASFASPLEKSQLFAETNRQLAELPRMPVAVVGRIPDMERATINNITEEGEQLKARYKQAGESYETLMTAPRADMGDSIRKAFRNVDDILQDMDLEITEDNERAIRIMGYNQITITEDNLDKVKEADRQVRTIMDRMKPGVTLNMIREGKNPLEMTLDELETTLNELDQDNIQDTEKYSSFLYRLEQNGSVNEAERKAYIGVYRLFRQVEKGDGAAIGSLVAQGAEVNLSNLLSAVRSRKAKHTDIRVDDSVGTLSEVNERGISISRQIEEGISEIRQQLASDAPGENLEEVLSRVDEAYEDKETQEKLAGEQLEEIREILTQDGHMEEYLRTYGQPATPDNLQSAANLTRKRGSSAKQLTDWESRLGPLTDTETEESDILQEADRFLSVLDQEEERNAAYDSMLETAGQVLEQTLESDSEVNYLDVKGIQGLFKQLSLASHLAQEENYEIPVRMGEEVTSINLKIIHSRENKGEVSITLDTERLGKVEARFQAYPDMLEGCVLTDYMDGKELLEGNASAFSEAINDALKETGIEMKNLIFGVNNKLDINAVTPVSHDQSKETPDTALLYKVAREFIRLVKTI